MPAARKRFFISYSREDKDLVEPIVELLRTAPTDVFFDLDSIEPGQNWTDRLERAIKGASSFVIFWCNHSSHSSWVRKEWTFAVSKKKRIIPVFLDSTVLPAEMKPFQGINFRRFAHGSHERTMVARERLEEEISAEALQEIAREAQYAPQYPRRIERFVRAIVAAAATAAGAYSLLSVTLTSFVLPVAAGIMLILIAFFLIKSLRSTKGVKRRVKERPVAQVYRPIVPAKPKDDDIKLMAQLLGERLQQEPLIPEASVDK